MRAIKTPQKPDLSAALVLLETIRDDAARVFEIERTPEERLAVALFALELIRMNTCEVIEELKRGGV